MIELKNALRKNPRNAEARRILGELYVKQGNGPAAEKELRRAMELGVAKEALLLPLAESLALQNKNQGILDEIDITNGLPARQQAILMVYRGDAWLKMGKVSKAEAEYERALQADPESALAKLGFARIAVAKKQWSQAEKILNEALAKAPKEAKLWRFKGHVAMLQGNWEMAEQAFTKALQHGGGNPFDLAHRALARIETGDLEGAEQDIETLRKAAPDFYLTRYVSGRMAFRKKAYEEALNEFEQSVRLNEAYMPAYYYLGIAYLVAGRSQEAIGVLSRYMNAFPNLVRAHQALALAQLQGGLPDQAFETLRPVALFLPDDPYTLRLMARIELARGNREKGVAYLERLVQVAPTNLAYLMETNEVLLKTGKKDAAMKILEDALALNPDSIPLQVQLVLNYIRNKKWEQAKQLADRLGQKLSDSTLPLNLAALLDAGKGEFDKAKSKFRQVLAQEPGNIVAAHGLAQILASQGDLQAAERIYVELLKQHPDHLQTQLRLARLKAREGDVQGVGRMLEQVVKAHPREVAPNVILAKYYLRFGRPELAVERAESLLQTHPDNAVALAVLVQAQLASHRPAQALESAHRLVSVAPENVLAHYLLAMAYQENGDLDGAEKAIDKVLEIRPEMLRAQLAKVKLLARRGENAEAAARLARLRERYPENPFVAEVAGWLAMRQGQPARAVDEYRRALASRPSSSLAIALAQAYWRSGHEDEAIATLRQWNADHPQDVQSAYLLSILYAKHGDTLQARRQLETVLRLRPDHVPALNDMAWMLREEAPDKALKYVKRALRKAPDFEPAVDTLAMILLGQGRPREAMEAMETLAEKSRHPVILYHWAQILAANGQKGRAIMQLRALAARKSPIQKRAEKLLSKLEGGE